MTSTLNWLRQHRLATFAGLAALTGLMAAPNFADAGHRRHARHCCCGGSYGYSGYGHGYSYAPHANYGYSNYGYSNYGRHYGYHSGSAYGSTWSQPGYAQSDIQYEDSYVPSQSDMSQPGGIAESQPRMAETSPQGERITSARPDLDAEGGVPPAPDAGAAAPSADSNQPQTRQQLQQRVNELEQENARLQQQLEDARGQNNDAQSAVEIEQGDTADNAAADAEQATPPAPQSQDVQEAAPGAESENQ